MARLILQGASGDPDSTTLISQAEGRGIYQVLLIKRLNTQRKLKYRHALFTNIHLYTHMSTGHTTSLEYPLHFKYPIRWSKKSWLYFRMKDLYIVYTKTSTSCWTATMVEGGFIRKARVYPSKARAPQELLKKVYQEGATPCSIHEDSVWMPPDLVTASDSTKLLLDFILSCK